MITLCCLNSILHFTVFMPMRFLAGSTRTHLIGAMGYDWSARSMGKAIDALHDAMVVLKKDGSKILEEDFMSQRSSPK